MKFLKNNAHILLCMVLIIILLLDRCNNNRLYEEELKRLEHNSKVSNDSIIKYYKNNLEINSKLAYKATLNELKEYNKTLFDNFKNIKGTPKSIIKTEIHYIYKDTILYKNDTIKIASNNIDSNITIPFSKVDSFNTLVGSYKISLFKDKDSILNIKPIGLFLDTFKVNANLTLGFEEYSDEFRVFAYSSNPNIVFNTLDGALIIPKPNYKKYNFFDKFGLGIHLGVGINSKFQVLPTISIGLNYNFIEFKDIFKPKLKRN